MSNLLGETYNPDVLSCLSNLSNDEVFTPPEVANQMLDMLPEELWRDPNATFLDPACKSGVFLREIAKRLIAGLEDDFPVLEERLEHIFKKQLYGIAITELTSLLSRRSLYCSKYPNCKYSVVTFDGPEGNIEYTQMDHTWEKGRCRYCGASEKEYDRGDTRETYAYEFVHLDDLNEAFDMDFDVIIGNPPYQLGSNGGTRDIPIYHKFVEQAKKLSPRYLSMIIPSRWMASGLGLSDFRKSMLSDKHIRTLVDYEQMDEVFPGVDFEGGVCFFLWDRDNEGPCSVTTISGNDVNGPDERVLDEYDIFVRDSRALEILHKVQAKKEPSILDLLSVDKEFGWTSNFSGLHDEKRENDVKVYYNRNGKRLVGWINREQITKSRDLVDTWKVMVPAAYGERGARPAKILGPSFIAESPSACTQTYLFFYVSTKEEAESLQTYLETRFFRFLVSLRKITQHATRSTYTWVPKQEWDRVWTDADLYTKYGISENEQAYIDSMIRPVEDAEK